MRTNPVSPIAVALLAAALVLAGCGRDRDTSLVGPGSGGATTGGAAAEPAAATKSQDTPAFDPADFVSGIDNPYLPFTRGAAYSYVGVSDEGVETIEVEVGIAMLADPEVGDPYAQEHAPGVAEDMAKVRSLDEIVTVPFGTFQHCLQTLEWSPLEPGHREYKYYAPGIGLVLEASTRGGKDRVELTSYSSR